MLHQTTILLGPWGLAMLSLNFTQKGLLYTKAQQAANDGGNYNLVNVLLDKFKHSLSLTLVHFYPLAGRLKTFANEKHEPSSLIYVDSNDSPGSKFIHARLDMPISHILSPTHVPLVVRSLFDHDDGHTISLLSVQVTELLDGIFIACSTNHSVMDGTSYWHFFHTWSEIFQAQDANAKGHYISISRPPIRWPLPNFQTPIHPPPSIYYQIPTIPNEGKNLPFFPPQSLATLKERANTEYNTDKISTFQSLSALVWRCVIRARGVPRDHQITSCILSINNRSRLEPPLSEDYFGNSSETVRAINRVDELMGKDLGWAAWELHEAVANHRDSSVREFVKKWVECPSVYQMGQFCDSYSVMMGSSPRFSMYGNEFGMGKGLAVRVGCGNKFDGKVSCL